MMENMTREMKYWCIIYTDGTLKTNRIPESITAQDELLDVIYEELVPGGGTIDHGLPRPERDGTHREYLVAAGRSCIKC